MADAMHRDILSDRLNAAWSEKPHSIALLAPSGAHNVAWTYENLFEQVPSPDWDFLSHTCYC